MKAKIFKPRTVAGKPEAKPQNLNRNSHPSKRIRGKQQEFNPRDGWEYY